MSENKRDKDSYAKDTLAFSVPSEERRRPQGQRPQGQRPQGQRTQGQYPQDQYPYGEYSQDQYPYEQLQGQNPQGQRPQGQSPQGQNPQGQRPQGQRPQGQRPQGQRPQGQRPKSQQPQGQRPQGQRPKSQQPQGQRPQGQNPQGQRPQGQRPKSQRPQGQRPKSQHPQGQKTQNNAKTLNNSKQNIGKQKVKKVRGRGGCLKRIICSLLGLFIVIFVIYSIISLSLISNVNIVKDGERGTPSHSLYSSPSVKNVLLIGTDSRGEDRGRSDSMIVLSINSKTNKISLVSLMRDTYVDIPGYGGDKLNAAYSYGGAELLMDTIEENFYIEVDDYFTINFISFANVVDAVGGVKIKVSDEEADAINVLLDSKEGKTLFGSPDESDYLNGGGEYKLNGKQALSYSRLRYVGNSDFERTERQRTVLTQMIKSAGIMNPFKLGKAAKDVLPSMNTNMSKFSMYMLSLRLPSFLIGYDIAQIRIPADGTYSSVDVNGQSALGLDIDANLEIIEKELY